jgi:hypothetical protein
LIAASAKHDSPINLIEQGSRNNPSEHDWKHESSIVFNCDSGSNVRLSIEPSAKQNLGKLSTKCGTTIDFNKQP